MLSSPGTQHHRRACDQCSIRKVKCGRSLPCPRCKCLSLECSYARPRKRKGPRGKRIGVIRNSISCRPTDLDSLLLPSTSMIESAGEESALVVTSSNIRDTTGENPGIPPECGTLFALEGSSSLDIAASSLLSTVDFGDSSTHLVSGTIKVDIGTMNCLIHSYVWRMSKYYPLVDSASILLRLYAGENSHNFGFGALLLAIGAFVLLEPAFKREEVLQDKLAFRERTRLAEMLMDNAITLRNMDPSYMERPTVDSILTSFFLCVSSFNRQLVHVAWSRLCEALMLAEIMIEQSTETDIITDDEKNRRATLYPILAVTEHAFAVQYRYKTSVNLFSRLYRSKFVTPCPGHLANPGLTTLVNLYSVITVDMLDCWSNKCAAGSPNGRCSNITTERVLDMHRFISQVFNFETAQCSEDQIADIAISQQWLHNRLWTICYTHRLINEESTTEGQGEMSITYALDIARDAMQISRKLTLESLEVNGLSLAGKLYDIVSSVVMLLSCYPSLRKARIQECKVVPSDLEILNQYVSLLATFGGGQHPYLMPLMMAVTELLPVC
ncbi:hypothetical protein V1525DRAFT_435549 [Lipomyces kononenkoae]|uniref:Uncharacterized protein n=1 Tax=Lipomyces kononenkoae TaxID=34357 RepID=A0ACC3SS80_LIPKO